MQDPQELILLPLTNYLRFVLVIGEVLSIIDTHQMNNSYASISPCGKFVASAGRYREIV